jgi:hypothetical protein
MVKVALSGCIVIYVGFDMDSQSKNNENQPHESIDDIIDDAVENAEIRRELSDDELDEAAGGGIIDTIIRFGGRLFS